VSVLCFKTILEQDSIHNEILVPPRQDCVGLKKPGISVFSIWSTTANIAFITYNINDILDSLMTRFLKE